MPDSNVNYPSAASPRLNLGAAYYPECWPEDIRRMRTAGLTVVRVAEFAWFTMDGLEI